MKPYPANTRAAGWAKKQIILRLVWGNAALLFACLTVVIARAASPPTTLHLSEYQKQDWQVEDGLPENYVRMIAQRPDGALLLATSSGLATFDGQRFQNVPIEVDGLIDNKAVNTMLFGRDHDLWIGTDGRGVLRRTASGTINISERAGRFNERIRTLYEDAEGVLWIATQNGVERFIGGKIEVLSEAGMISGDITTPFAEDGAGGMFFVTSSGLFHWADGITRQFLFHSSPGIVPVAVYRDFQHRIWVGTATGVLQLIPRKNSSRDLTDRFDQISKVLVDSPVTVLQGDPAGNLWIGTRRDGIWRLGADGISHWSSRNGLPEETVP